MSENEMIIAIKPEIKFLTNPKNMKPIYTDSKYYLEYHKRAGLYSFWWIGNKNDFISRIEGQQIYQKKETYTNWQILDLPHIPLYVGRTGGTGKNRLHHHATFFSYYGDKGMYALNNLGHVFSIPHENKLALKQLILSNVSFSFVQIGAVVERFYLEALSIGLLKPYFNKL